MFMEYQIIIKLIRTEQECLEAASFDDWNENDKLLLEKLAQLKIGRINMFNRGLLYYIITLLVGVALTFIGFSTWKGLVF